MSEADRNKNVGNPERLLSGVLGGALVLKGLSSGGFGGLLLAGAGGMLVHRGTTGHCQVYRRLELDTTRESYDRGIEVRRSVTVGKSPEEVYRFWRDLENLPRVFQRLQSVTAVSETVSQWQLRERGTTFKWTAEIIDDAPGRRIAFQTIEESDLSCEGEVTFEGAPGERGTEVRLEMRFSPPGGTMAMALAPLLRRMARSQLGLEMGRLKQLLETGEIATAETLSATRRQQLGQSQVSRQRSPDVRPARERGESVLKPPSKDVLEVRP